MAKLTWISDNALKEAVNHLLLKAKEANLKANKQFGKNVIDPFSAIFEISGFQIDYDTWIKKETARQAQKTLQNHVGEFHQIILGSVNDWKNLRMGQVIDLVSEKNQVIAEVKNKYNTISGGKLADLYQNLESLVMPKSSIYKGYTAYYVAIIPKNKNRYNREFTPSNKEVGEKCASNIKIREIDGASFYDLVTNTKNSLEQLYNVLPLVISECLGGDYIVGNLDKLKTFFNSAFETLE